MLFLNYYVKPTAQPREVKEVLVFIIIRETTMAKSNCSQCSKHTFPLDAHQS